MLSNPIGDLWMHITVIGQTYLPVFLAEYTPQEEDSARNVFQAEKIKCDDRSLHLIKPTGEDDKK